MEISNKTDRTFKLRTFVHGTGGKDNGTVILHKGNTVRISDKWDEVTIEDIK